MLARKKIRRQSSGFTLIELVIGMTVMVIVIGLVLSALLPREKQSAELIHMIRAAELSKSLIAEISAKRFDEKSNPSLLLRCNELSTTPCTSASALGAEDAVGEDSTDRFTFDDVDDYHGLNLTDIDLASYYKGFSVSVNVAYDNDFDGKPDSSDLSAVQGSNLSKRINVTITTPLEMPIEYIFFKANY